MAGDPKTITHRVYRKVDPKVEFATSRSTQEYFAKCGLWG